MSPHRSDWKFQGGGEGSSKANNLKKSMKLNWNFQGEGVLEKISPVGEVQVFSGST